MYCAANVRAAALRSALTASSKSRISASAPAARPLASLRSSSAGMNRRERIGASLFSFSPVIAGFCYARFPAPTCHPGSRAAGEAIRNLVERAVPLPHGVPRGALLAFGSHRSVRDGGLLFSILRPPAHHGLAPALSHRLAALVDGLVQEFDDTGIGARARLAPGKHLCGHVQRIAVEDRLGEFHIGHAEVADGGAE